MTTLKNPFTEFKHLIVNLLINTLNIDSSIIH